ncbi:MAG: ATP-binding protein, partial [Planctomycetota bacterium]
MFKYNMSLTTRITFGIVTFATTIAMLGLGLGLLPNHTETVRKNRAALCESLASNGALMSEVDFRRWGKLLEFAVSRNDELLSAGVRKKTGRLYVEVAQHEGFWPDPFLESSTENCIFVPIFSSQNPRSAPMEWGRIEMRFQSIKPNNPIAASIASPYARFLCFFAAVSGLVLRWYMGRVLQNSEAETAVPRRIRNAYDFLAGGLVAINKEGKIKLANTAFKEITGLDKLVGKQLKELAWTDLGDESPWQTALERQELTPSQTMGFMNASRGKRSLSVSASPVIGQDGHGSGVLVSCEDVTPMEEAKAALEQSKEEAEAANVAKSEFLANMSHEIRTPMNAILGFADIMRRGYESGESERQEYLNIIHSSGQHLLGLINDILDLSKVESGHMEIEKISCTPYQLTREVLTILNVRAAEKNLELKAVVEGKIPETITTDPTRLRQVITNLVGNAIKFTDQGGVTVVLRMLDDGLMCFDVKDTGIGIDTDKLNAIFDPFSQADSSTTRKYGGTGLGLSISRKLAVILGGKLSVSSVVNEGSTFSISIDPGDVTGVRLISAEDAAASSQLRTESESNAEFFSGRVLVVDDGESNRKLVELVLSRVGVDVESAENGKIAVDKSRTNEYDFILMDVSMPVMDGYTAMSIIRENGNNVPIIALTAHAMAGEKEKALEAGFTGFLVKPLEIDKLMKFAQKYLEAAATPKAVSPMRDLGTAATRQQPERSTSEDAGRDFEVPQCLLPLDDPEFLEIAHDFHDHAVSKCQSMALLWSEGTFEELSREA